MDSRAYRPLLVWAGVLVGALALAGCGGEEDAAPETLPAGVAEALAQASDEVAASLEAGDGCAAAKEAAELRDAALAAVEDGRVPGDLVEPLLGAVERLEGQIVCAEGGGTAPQDEEKKEKEKKDPPGKAKGKDKDKDEDEDEEPPEETPTEETPTETEEDDR
ncbi:MAG: hypothetical protein ACRDNI_06065 [Gaiellaceae bacterium]